MDEKKKKLVLGSVAGVALTIAAVMLISNFMPSSPKLELSSEQQQQVAKDAAEMEKAQEQAAAEVRPEPEEPADANAPKPEHAGGVRYRVPKSGG